MPGWPPREQRTSMGRWQEQRAGVYGAPIRVSKQPVGVVAAVVPWNMPQFLIVTKMVPALLAGCTIVLKPAPEAALDALFLADIVSELGLPPGVVNVVPADREASARLVSHPDLDKVSFTGSTATGRQVAAACGQQLTRVSLELGGKSAAIALADADPQEVATGWYVRPTLFSAVDNAMTIAQEEIFGPVLVVTPYRDEDEAVRLANASPYGLAGSVFTADVEHGVAIAGRVRTGSFGVNQGYSMDPIAPFGGVKGSGYGRELGREGLEGYLDVRSISVA